MGGGDDVDDSGSEGESITIQQRWVFVDDEGDAANLEKIQKNVLQQHQHQHDSVVNNTKRTWSYIDDDDEYTDQQEEEEHHNNLTDYEDDFSNNDDNNNPMLSWQVPELEDYLEAFITTSNTENDMETITSLEGLFNHNELAHISQCIQNNEMSLAELNVLIRTRIYEMQLLTTTTTTTSTASNHNIPTPIDNDDKILMDDDDDEQSNLQIVPTSRFQKRKNILWAIGTFMVAAATTIAGYVVVVSRIRSNSSTLLIKNEIDNSANIFSDDDSSYNNSDSTNNKMTCNLPILIFPIHKLCSKNNFRQRQ
jgi:hypothetical protein